jgi:hypothetical protein
VVTAIGVACVALLLAETVDPKPVAEPAYETVVVAPSAPSRNGSLTFGGREAAALPGTAGDPGRALENAPGVGRVAPAGEGLVLWGAAPAESKVLFDGVEIPALFHFGGWRSIVPVEGIGTATVVPGAFGADLGRALGGLVKIESTNPTTEGWHAWTAADPFDATAGFTTALGGRVGLFVAGRAGYVDRFADLISSRAQRALVPLPSYRDGLAKLSVDLGEGRSLTVEALGATDRRDLTLDPTSPIDILAEARARSVARGVVRYLEADGDEVTSAMAFVGRDHSALDQQLGLVPVSLHATDMSFGGRVSHGLMAGRHWFEIGVDALMGVWDVARVGSLTNPAREGDGAVFGAPPAGPVGADAWHPILGNLAPYALAELRWGRLEIDPGLRLEGTLVSGDHVLPPTGLTPREGFSRTTWSREPRLALKVAATRWLDVSAAGGIHHQAPEAADLSAVFGSPTLPPGRSVDGVISAGIVHGGLRIETAAFARQLDALAVRNPDPQAAPAQSLVADGRGRSHGVQLLARRSCRGPGVCAFFAYTLSRSERRGPRDLAWRLLDYDQTHVLTAALGYRGRQWYAGGRLRYATGMPRTSVLGAFYDAAAGQYRPVRGTINDSRLPDFAEIDLRLERSWRRGSATLTLSAEILNVTDRANPEEIVYTGDYSGHAYLMGLPILALAGFRLEI